MIEKVAATATRPQAARSGCIGVVSYTSQTTWFSQILAGIEEALTQSHASLWLSSLLQGDRYDAGAVLDWIRTQPHLDAEKVLIQGGSYGGYLALSAAANYNDRISATLSYLGPTSLILQLENDLLPADEIREEYGDERDHRIRTFLERIAPLNNSQKIKKPVFIIQGKNDRRVPYKAGEQMTAALKKQGTPVWYLLAVDEGHGFASPGTYEYMFLAKVVFAQTHLLSR